MFCRVKRITNLLVAAWKESRTVVIMLLSDVIFLFATNVARCVGLYPPRQWNWVWSLCQVMKLNLARVSRKSLWRVIFSSFLLSQFSVRNALRRSSKWTSLEWVISTEMVSDVSYVSPYHRLIPSSHVYAHLSVTQTPTGFLFLSKLPAHFALLRSLGKMRISLVSAGDKCARKTGITKSHPHFS